MMTFYNVIITLQQKDVHISHNVAFDPNGSGQEVWEDLLEDGKLDCTGKTKFMTACMC